MRLRFDHAKGGFVSTAEKITGFEAAGADGKYIPAAAEIDGEDILISANGVDEPRFVRYLWTNYTDVTLFGVNGIPLAPFRSSLKDGSEKEVDLTGK